MLKRLVLAGILAITLPSALQGCAPMPSQQEIASADYGSPISQADAEAQVRAAFEIRLKDPESARYSFGAVQQGYIVTSLVEGRKLMPGYMLDVTVNAKNSYGGYTGGKPYRFMFHEGRIAGAWEITPSGASLKFM